MLKFATKLARWYRQSDWSVRHRSQYENIYHCTLHKCASQWLRGIFSDPRIFTYSGLRLYQYQDRLPCGHDPRKIPLRTFAEPFPVRSIATPLYIDYANFVSMPRPTACKAIFVMRDPRDMLVSWYFSSKYSHPLVGDLDCVRRELNRLSETDGLIYAIDYLEAFGLFAAQRSWAGAAADRDVLLLRFEDLTASANEQVFANLLRHCDIRMPDAILQDVLRTHSFESLSRRPRGQEDRSAHYRKGSTGDWRNYFTDEVRARFETCAGDLLGLWNYSGERADRVEATPATAPQ